MCWQGCALHLQKQRQRPTPAFDSFTRLMVGADRWSARGRIPLLRNGL